MTCSAHSTHLSSTKQVAGVLLVCFPSLNALSAVHIKGSRRTDTREFTPTCSQFKRQMEERERQVSANLSAKASRHEASLRASAEVERLLSIRRENVHKSREDKDQKIAKELLEKEKKLKEKVRAQ